MSFEAPRPLSGKSPNEIPLATPPLVRAIAQIRFPAILAIQQPETVSKFQEAIRGVYPFLTQDQIQAIDVGPTGANLRQETFWRFTDKETSPEFRISLGMGFLSIEAFKYSSRADFIVRFHKVVSAAQKAFRPAEVQRLGIRYVNRIVNEGWAHRAKMLHSQVIGIEHSSASLRHSVVHAITEAHLVAVEGSILARFGRMQANATYDPDTLAPFPEPSWIIDLDMYSSDPLRFDAATVSSKATDFSKRLYGVFREMVTDEFIRFYGGAS